MPISNLPSVRRSVPFRALSFALRILEKVGLMRQPLQTEALLASVRRQRDRGQWPRIAEEAIIAPLFITGLPRTGTTLLHGLLAQDHDLYYAPATWEVMFPSPPPSLGENKRIKRAERRLAGFDWPPGPSASATRSPREYTSPTGTCKPHRAG
jgi:Sulfotransferase family